MITQKFNNKDYQIPQEWIDVTVSMLIQAALLSELLEDASIIAIISAYTGIPVKELKLNQRDEVLKIIDLMAFISKPYEPIPRTSFEFQGQKYSCEDDLINQRFEDFVSIQTTLYNNREEPTKALSRLLAIYCKKDGETLDDFNLDERSKLMEGVSMTIAKDIEAFFLHSLNAYKSISLLSSTQDEQRSIVLENLKELRSTIKKSKEQIGGFSLTKLQIGIFQIYLWLWQKELVKYYNTQPIKHSKKLWKAICKKLHTKMLKRENNGDSNGKFQNS